LADPLEEELDAILTTFASSLIWLGVTKGAMQSALGYAIELKTMDD